MLLLLRCNDSALTWYRSSLKLVVISFGLANHANSDEHRWFAIQSERPGCFGSEQVLIGWVVSKFRGNFHSSNSLVLKSSGDNQVIWRARVVDFEVA